MRMVKEAGCRSTHNTQMCMCALHICASASVAQMCMCKCFAQMCMCKCCTDVKMRVHARTIHNGHAHKHKIGRAHLHAHAHVHARAQKRPNKDVKQTRDMGCVRVPSIPGDHRMRKVMPPYRDSDRVSAQVSIPTPAQEKSTLKDMSRVLIFTLPFL